MAVVVVVGGCSKESTQSESSFISHMCPSPVHSLGPGLFSFGVVIVFYFIFSLTPLLVLALLLLLLFFCFSSLSLPPSSAHRHTPLACARRHTPTYKHTHTQKSVHAVKTESTLPSQRLHLMSMYACREADQNKLDWPERISDSRLEVSHPAHG